MNQPESANNMPDKNTPIRPWVWHCSEASVAAKQISVLSVLETLCVLALYYYLAFHFERQWWPLISAVAAPIILLRSPESKAFGVKLLASFSVERKDPTTIVSVIFERVIAPSFILDIFLLVILIAKTSGWTLFWEFFEIVLLLIGAIVVIWFAHKVLGDDIIYNTVGNALAFVSMVVFAVQSAIVLIAICLFIWSYSLWIRAASTLRYPLAGLRQLPENWRENMLIVDLSQLPELLPGAGQVSEEYTLEGLIKVIKDKKDNIRSFFSIILAVLYYFPAIAWRWSIKATLWLWWPLVFLVQKPLEAQQNLPHRRDLALRRIWLSSGLISIAFVTGVWLLSAFISPAEVTSLSSLFLGERSYKILEKLLQLYPKPLPVGLRYWILSISSVLAAVFWLHSRYFKKLCPKVFSDEGVLNEQIPEVQRVFIDHALLQERLYTVLVVSFILSGYAFALYLGNLYYPTEAVRFIPAGLIHWL